MEGNFTAKNIHIAKLLITIRPWAVRRYPQKANWRHDEESCSERGLVAGCCSALGFPHTFFSMPLQPYWRTTHSRAPVLWSTSAGVASRWFDEHKGRVTPLLLPHQLLELIPRRALNTPKRGIIALSPPCDLEKFVVEEWCDSLACQNPTKKHSVGTWYS